MAVQFGAVHGPLYGPNPSDNPLVLFPTTSAGVTAYGLPAPTAIWPLQEAASATTADDILGSYDLTAANSPTSGVSTTLQGGTRLAWRFTNGGTTRLDAANVADFNTGSPLVIAGLWKTATNPAANSQVVGARDSTSPNAGWEFYMNTAGAPQLVVDWGASQVTITSATTHTDSNWHPFMVCIDEDGDLRAWFNTDLVAPTEGTLTAGATQVSAKLSVGRGRIASLGCDVAYLVAWTGANAQGWLSTRSAKFEAFKDMVGF